MVSFGNPARGLAPVSTLIPGSTPSLVRYSGKGTPLAVFCRRVSS